MDQKVPLDKVQFLENWWRFFTKISEFTAEGVFNWTMLETSLKYLYCFKNYSFYNIVYFTIILKKWTVTCNVQCSTSLNIFAQITCKCPSHLSHKLDVFLWSSVFLCWLSPAVAGLILTARLSSVHQCVLWLGMKCLLVFKHNSPDIIIEG